MMLFTAIIGVEVNLRTRISNVVSPKAQLEIVNIVEKAMTMVTAQHLVKNALNVAKRIMSSLYARLVVQIMINMIIVDPGLKRRRAKIP